MRLPFSLARGKCMGESIAHREKGQGAMPLAQVEGLRAFARQRRANSRGQLLGGRGRTGCLLYEKCIQRKKLLTLFGIQRKGVSSFLLHAGRCCFLNALRSEKARKDRLGSAQTRQGSSPCTSGGLRPSTHFFIFLPRWRTWPGRFHR